MTASVRIAFSAAAALLAAGLATPLPVAAQVTLGVAAPLTGPRANLGRYTRQGVDLAVAEINAAGGVLGKPLQVVYEDDQADNPNAYLVMCHGRYPRTAILPNPAGRVFGN